MNQISAIMTVYNRREVTLSCLKALYAQTIPDGFTLNTYIIDGGSNDNTVAAVRECFPQVRIRVKQGAFWNRGMWHAWDWAVNDVEQTKSERSRCLYLWLNDDTVLFDGCLENLILSSGRYSDSSIIVGATVDTKSLSVQTYGGRVRGEFVELNGEDRDVDSFNGNIVLVPSKVYDSLGNLDFYYAHSKGDFDYGIRARKAGIRMIQIGHSLGACDAHPCLDKWCNPNVPFRERLKMLHKPNGMPPKETFHLEKQISFPLACVHFFTVYIRCFFPKIWTRFGKVQGENRIG